MVQGEIRQLPARARRCEKHRQKRPPESNNDRRLGIQLRNRGLPREAEDRLKNEAARHGVDEAAYASRLVVRGLPESNDALNEDVRSFVHEHHLAVYLDVALRLVAEHFGPAAIEIEKVDDPEFLDSWISLGVRVDGDVDSALNAYNSFTRQFAELVSPESSGKIRLSLGWADVRS